MLQNVCFKHANMKLMYIDLLLSNYVVKYIKQKFIAKNKKNKNAFRLI